MKLKDMIPGYNSLVLPYHWGQAVAAGVKFGRPGRRMRVIGVTGTNGKTTTCFMIWKMLNTAGHKTGVMTTVGWGVPGNKAKGVDKDGIVKQVEHMTTADSMTLNRRMKAIADAGAEFLVLEVTSHAMAQFRTLMVPIEIAVMTNVTHEHLDYHKTFEQYRDAKRKLFKKADFGVINADDGAAEFFGQDVRKYITYGINHGEKRAKNIKKSASGVKYACGDINIETQIPGEFNVYNSLAALCVGEKLGLTAEQIKKGIFALESVEGRMNRVDVGQNFDVIVDYAHAPDAFVKVFDSVRGTVKGKIITVTGGAGRRDKTTRAERGELAAKNSDVLIITEDDSRDEPPAEIAEMFVEGAKKCGMVLGNNLHVELDRRKAIEMALNMAKAGDLVLILGKGHEKTILRADGAYPFEDLKVTEELLRAKKAGKKS